MTEEKQLVCPVKKPQPSTASKCPVNHNKSNSSNITTAAATEPPDTVDHFMKRNAPHYASKVIEKPDSTDIHDMIPGEAIPATGRGNSESGEQWLNPSANQLYHSLKRKSKVCVSILFNYLKFFEIS